MVVGIGRGGDVGRIGTVVDEPAGVDMVVLAVAWTGLEVVVVDPGGDDDGGDPGGEDDDDPGGGAAGSCKALSARDNAPRAEGATIWRSDGSSRARAACRASASLRSWA